MVQSSLIVQEIPSTDCRFLRLADASIYLNATTVENAILEITPPDSSCPVIFNVTPYFNNVYNSVNLKLTNTLVSLPDGIYTIDYSINPNLKTKTTYKILKNCKLVNKYLRIVSEFLVEECSISEKCLEETKKQLIWIKELIDSSKYLVENSDKTKEGLFLYKEANKLLDKLNIHKCF